MNRVKAIIDTNLIVYAFDLSETRKRNVCKKLIEDVFKGKRKMYISNQILGEFFNVVTRFVKRPLSIEHAKEIVKGIIESENWIKVNYTVKTIEKALGLVEKFNIGFWDALIVATMMENDIDVIYTENEKDFKKVPGIKVINPIRKTTYNDQ